MAQGGLPTRRGPTWAGIAQARRGIGRLIWPPLADLQKLRPIGIIHSAKSERSALDSSGKKRQVVAMAAPEGT